MTPRVPGTLRWWLCGLALAVWAGSLPAQDGTISSGDASGGGELPKTAGSGSGGTNAKPPTHQPTSGAPAPPPAPVGVWHGWGGDTPGGGGVHGHGGAGAGGGSGGGSAGHGGNRGAGGGRHVPADAAVPDAQPCTGTAARLETVVVLVDGRGRPLARVAVGVLDAEGRLVALARTDARGIAVLSLPVADDLSLIGERLATDVPCRPGREHLLLID